MRIILPLIMTILLWGDNAEAVKIEAGKQYPAGTLMEDTSWPVTYIIPAGWTGKRNNADDLVLLTAKDGSGSILISPGESTAKTELRDMSKPIEFGNVRFTPTRKPTVEKINSSGAVGIQCEYSVSANGKTLNGYIATLIDHNNVNVTYFLFHNGNNMKTLQISMNSLIRSTTLSDPDFNPEAERLKLVLQGKGFYRPENAAPAPLPQTRQQTARRSGNPDWSSHLNGKRWYYVKCGSYSGCTKRKIWTCGDGTFWTSSASSYFSQGGAGTLSYNSQNPGNVGRWQAINTSSKDSGGFTVGKLLLNYFDGSHVELEVTMPADQEGTYFNGTYYGFRGQASGCLD